MNMLRRIPLCLYANISALLTAERMTVARTHGTLLTMLEELCWGIACFYTRVDTGTHTCQLRRVGTDLSPEVVSPAALSCVFIQRGSSWEGRWSGRAVRTQTSMAYHSIALKLAESLKFPILGENVEQQEMSGITGRSPRPRPHIKDDLAACSEVKEIVHYSS